MKLSELLEERVGHTSKVPPLAARAMKGEDARAYERSGDPDCCRQSEIDQLCGNVPDID